MLTKYSLRYYNLPHCRGALHTDHSDDAAVWNCCTILPVVTGFWNMYSCLVYCLVIRWAAVQSLYSRSTLSFNRRSTLSLCSRPAVALHCRSTVSLHYCSTLAPVALQSLYIVALRCRSIVAQHYRSTLSFYTLYIVALQSLYIVALQMKKTI